MDINHLEDCCRRDVAKSDYTDVPNFVHVKHEVIDEEGSQSTKTLNIGHECPPEYVMTTVTTERQIVKEFLESYRDFTCLWDRTSQLYNNKDARNQSLQVLQEKLQIIEPDATIITVKKRIENMRAGYKREWKKVQESKNAGAGADEVYVPSLWYYEYLTFLDEKNTAQRNGVDISNCDDEEVSDTQTKISRLTPVKRRATSLWKKQVHLTEPIQNLPFGDIEENPAECFGRAMGLQLKEMSNLQRCIAEKLISEVIFYGKLEKLTMQSSILINGSPAPTLLPDISASVSHPNYESPNYISHTSDDSNIILQNSQNQTFHQQLPDSQSST